MKKKYLLLFSALLTLINFNVWPASQTTTLPSSSTVSDASIPNLLPPQAVKQLVQPSTAQTSTNSSAESKSTPETNPAIASPFNPSRMGASNQLNINPIIVIAQSNEVKHDFTISNQGEKSIIIQVKATAQIDPFKPSSAIKTKDLIINPPIKLLKPNEAQIFRVVIRTPSTEKKVYRLYYQEVLPKPKLNPEDKDKKQILTSVNIGLQFGVPLYYNYTTDEVAKVQQERARQEHMAQTTTLGKAEKTIDNVTTSLQGLRQN